MDRIFAIHPVDRLRCHLKIALRAGWAGPNADDEVRLVDQVCLDGGTFHERPRGGGFGRPTLFATDFAHRSISVTILADAALRRALHARTMFPS
jgi:hypothetical protein